MKKAIQLSSSGQQLRTGLGKAYAYLQPQLYQLPFSYCDKVVFRTPASCELISQLFFFHGTDRGPTVHIGDDGRHHRPGRLLSAQAIKLQESNSYLVRQLLANS